MSVTLSYLWRAVCAVLICMFIGNIYEFMKAIGITYPPKIDPVWIRSAQFATFFLFGESVGKLVTKKRYERLMKTGFKD